METQASVACSAKDNILTVCLSGEIDHHTVRGVRREIDEALFSFLPQKLFLDLSHVNFMDSSGLGLIVGRLASAREIDAEMVITGASPRIRKIFEMAGLFRMEGLSLEEKSKKKEREK